MSMSNGISVCEAGAAGPGEQAGGHRLYFLAVLRECGSLRALDYLNQRSGRPGNWTMPQGPWPLGVLLAEFGSFGAVKNVYGACVWVVYHNKYRCTKHTMFDMPCIL